MQEPEVCSRESIPIRLHRMGRPKLEAGEASDHLYIRHPPRDMSEPYILQIPGHNKLQNQSVNSELLNAEGSPSDVLFNTKCDPHFTDSNIAKIAAQDVINLQLPNPHVMRVVKAKTTNEPVVYQFKIEHDPTPCMYPHCVIQAYKDGEKVDKNIDGYMKTEIRKIFAKLAEKWRESMIGKEREFRVSTSDTPA